MSTYPKIVVSPPGPKARKILLENEKFLSPSIVKGHPLVVKSTNGCIIKDVDDNEYIDFNSGVSVMNVGHNHPEIIKAIIAQSKKVIHYSTDFYYNLHIELAKKLNEITPGDFQKKVFFSNSGTESVEAAIKIAKWHTRKHRFISFIGAFHGRTIGALSFTASKPVQRRYFFPLLPGVTHVPYPYCYRCPFKQSYPECNYFCIDFIEESVFQRYIPPEETAAIIYEPILGEGGYIVPPPEYFKRLKKLAEKYGILLIADEVQTGVGRTGRWFAMEHWGVTPDIFCLAKAIASGIPLGVTIAKERLMDWEEGAHTNTFGGNLISCASASAVIDIIKKEKLLDNAVRQGNYLIKRLNEMKNKYSIIGDVRGKGLMIGVEIIKNIDTEEPGKTEAEEIVLKCWKRGLTLLKCGTSTIRIFPPLIITQDLIDRGLAIFEKTIKKVSEKHSSNF